MNKPSNITKNTINNVGFDTVIGTMMVIDGRIDSRGSVRIEGTVKGPVNVEGNLLVGETGQITGEVTATSVDVSGYVGGNICADSVRFASSARVKGDIISREIAADPGAYIDGRFVMDEPAQAEVKPIPVDEAKDYRNAGLKASK